MPHGWHRGGDLMPERLARDAQGMPSGSYGMPEGRAATAVLRLRFGAAMRACCRAAMRVRCLPATSFRERGLASHVCKEGEVHFSSCEAEGLNCAALVTQSMPHHHNASCVRGRRRRLSEQQ
eukprot:2873106-Pleurochrysis_carterae.AAC.2